MEDSSVKPIAGMSSFSKLVSECSSALGREEGSYLQEVRDQEPTQLLEDNEIQEMNLCQEECLDDFVQNFDETQLLEDYDDSGGRSTHSPIRRDLQVRKLEIVDSDAETEDGEEDQPNVESIIAEEQQASAKQLSSTHSPHTCRIGLTATGVVVQNEALGTALPSKWKLEIVDSDAETEDGEEDQPNVESIIAEEQQASAKQLSSTHSPHTCRIGLTATGVVVQNEALGTALPSSFKSIGSFRADSMQLTAALPLTWKPSIILDFASSKDKETSEILEPGPLISGDMDLEQGALQQEAICGASNQIQKGDERSRKFGGFKDANLEVVVPTVLSFSAKKSPRDQIGVEGLTTEPFSVMHDQMVQMQESPEPEWMVRKAAVDANSAVCAFQRRKITKGHSCLSKEFTNGVENGEEKMNNAEEENHEIGIELRRRSLFPEVKALEDESQIPDHVSSMAITKLGPEPHLRRNVDTPPPESKANMNEALLPALKLLCPTRSMSYLDSQEPGDERQAQALSIVDKLVWLDNSEMSQGPVLPGLHEVNSPHPSSTTPAHPTQAYVPRNSLGVYEWVDSQHDEAGPASAIGKGDVILNAPSAKSGHSRLSSGASAGRGRKEISRGSEQGQQEWVASAERFKNAKKNWPKQMIKSQQKEYLEAKLSEAIRKRKSSDGFLQAEVVRGHVTDENQKSMQHVKPADSSTKRDGVYLKSLGGGTFGEKNPHPSTHIVARRVEQSVPESSTDSDDLLTNFRRPASAKKMVLLAELLKDQPSSEQKLFVNGEGEDGDETLLEFVARRHVSKGKEQKGLDKKRKATSTKAGLVEQVKKRLKSPKQSDPRVTRSKYVDRQSTGYRKIPLPKGLSEQSDCEADSPAGSGKAKEQQVVEERHGAHTSMKRIGERFVQIRPRKKARSSPMSGHVQTDKRHGELAESACSPLPESPNGRQIESQPVMTRTKITSDKPVTYVTENRHGEEEKSIEKGHSEMEGLGDSHENGTSTFDSSPVPVTCFKKTVKTPSVMTRTKAREMQKTNESATPPATPPACTPISLPLGKNLTKSGEMCAPPQLEKPVTLSSVECTPQKSQSASDHCTTPLTPASASHTRLSHVEKHSPVVRTRRRTAERYGDSTTLKSNTKEQEMDLEPNVLSATMSDTPNTPPNGSPFSISTEGKRKRRGASPVLVLFSHGLDKRTIKRQCKIVCKLGGKVVKDSAESTHFITDSFQRTGNMLEAMATGKPVLTPAWLDSCAQAHCFLDERKYYLEDEKKQKELGFSMCTTISAAQQKRIFQGVEVYITPNTSPTPQALGSLITAAGGLALYSHAGSIAEDLLEKDFVVISNEMDYALCKPFLGRGAKVCSPELIYEGIITHHLDFIKHNLFDSYHGK